MHRNNSQHYQPLEAPQAALISSAPHGLPFNPLRRVLNSAKQTRHTAARAKLHDLWTPCLLEYLRQEAASGRPHTRISLEKHFASLVAKPKGFVQPLIRALIERGVIRFFHPLPKDNLPRSPSRYGYLHCEGMAWGDAESITQPPAPLHPSNENAEVVMITPLQGV